MLESCLTPQIVHEITLQPVRRHGVDAAIFFSDIVIPLKLAGIGVDIVAGVGPVIANPIRSSADLERLTPISSASLTPIRQAAKSVVQDLGHIPLIAFGGAPFTLASYLIEGGPSRDLPVSRAMMRENPELWETILTWCAEITASFIEAQVISGASAFQVFDSWAGKLRPDEYRRYAAPYSRHLLDSLSHLVDASGQRVPRIHFGVGTSGILRDMADVGATALGVDAATHLADVEKLVGRRLPIQGNIDPGMLDAPWSELSKHIDDVLESGRNAPGHVVNLGHGVPPTTDPEVLTRIVTYVHEVTASW